MEHLDDDLYLLSGLGAWLPDVLHLTHPKAPQITCDFLGRRKNVHTQKAYGRTLKAFLLWVERAEYPTLAALTATDVSNYVKGLQRSSRSAPQPLSNRTRAQIIACLRRYFNDLVRGGALPSNPAAAIETFAVKVKVGHYKALEPSDMARLLDSIDAKTLQGLQDRAIIGLMAYSCARVGAVVKMKLGDVYEQAGRLHVCLNEKRDARHYMPCHPELEDYLRGFLSQTTGAAPTDCDPNPAKWLFRRWDKKRKRLSGRPLTHMICYAMVKRRTRAIGLDGVTNHSFRATGITTFLRSGGALDDARRLANHSSVNTTKLYDHRTQAVSEADVQRISYR